MAFTTSINSIIPRIAVILAIFASGILSVDAIRCHQCNSHLDEDCIALRLVTPHLPLDKQFLKECNAEETFCRKVITKIEVTGEQRIVRSCGRIDTNLKKREGYCFDADNEGFQQTICACFEDGCNAAPQLGGNTNRLIIWSLTAFSVLLAAVWRH